MATDHFDPQDFEQFAAAMAGGPCPNGWYPVPRWRDVVDIYLAPSYGTDANSGYKREQAVVATPERTYMLVQEAKYANRPWRVLIPRGEVIYGRLTGQVGYNAWAHGGSGGKPGYIAADPNDDPSLPRPIFMGARRQRLQGLLRRYPLDLTGVSRRWVRRVRGRSLLWAVFEHRCVGRLEPGVFRRICHSRRSQDKPHQNVTVSRSASKWNFRVSGYAQGVFVSCAEDVTFNQFVMHQNGYRWTSPIDYPDVGSHNAYNMPNANNVHYVECVTTEPSATGLQLRGLHQTATGCVAINCPLGITAGHAQAAVDEDSSASIEGNLIIGGGNIPDQPPPAQPLPRSLSVGVNRAAGRANREQHHLARSDRRFGHEHGRSVLAAGAITPDLGHLGQHHLRTTLQPSRPEPGTDRSR